MKEEEMQILEDLKKVFKGLKKDLVKLDLIKKESILDNTENVEGKESNKEEKSIDENTQYFEHTVLYSSEKPSATYTENYKEGDSSLFVPGTYLQIFRQHEYLMGSSLFGFTTPSMGYNVVVRGDLKGEPFRDVRAHEAYHWTQRAGEMDTREATGTHMDVFLPKLHKMYSSI